MNSKIWLYSMQKKEIEKFLSKFFCHEIILNKSEWECKYQNPVEMAEIIGVFADNKDDFKINMWVSIDEGISINITNRNANSIIKYLYERFPY